MNVEDLYDTVAKLSKSDREELATELVRLNREEWLPSYLATIDGMDIGRALWWFIENFNDEHPLSTALYWRLRERVAVELPS